MSAEAWRNLAVVAIVAVLGGAVIVMALQPDGGPGIATVVDPASITATPGTSGGSTSSALLLIQGLADSRLVIWPLDNSHPPQEIDRQVSAWPLLPDPGGRYVLYSTRRAVLVLDRAAQRAAIVGTLPDDGKIAVAQWSPDSRALAYVVQTGSRRTAQYTLADGSIAAQVMQEVPVGLPLDVGWLPEGDPATIALGIGPVGGLEAQFQRYDPRLGESFPLPPDTSVIQPWSPWRSPGGDRQAYSVKSWDESRYQGQCDAGPLAVTGGGWLYADTIVHSMTSAHHILFEMEGVYLDRPTWLQDGRVLFRATADKACTPLPSGIYLAAPGDEPALFVAAEPDYVSDDSDKLLWGTSYALSPDQAQVAWSWNDVEAGRGTIQLSPLDGGETSALFTTGPAPGPAEFKDSSMILYFVWLP